MYSPFQKTLPKSSLQMNWVSVRFYEMGDIQIYVSYIYKFQETPFSLKKNLHFLSGQGFFLPLTYMSAKNTSFFLDGSPKPLRAKLVCGILN